MKVTEFKELASGEDNLIITTILNVAERDGQTVSPFYSFEFSRIFRLGKGLGSSATAIARGLKLPIISVLKLSSI